MYRVDLHVHTRLHSPCAEFLEPLGLGAAMRRAGIDAVVLTEHDAYWSSADTLLLRTTLGCCRIFFGVELSAVDGHVVAVGLRVPIPIDKSRSVERTAEAVRAAGGIAVLVHPLKGGRRWAGDPPPAIGAVEVASTVTSGAVEAETRNLALRWNLPAVAGSDAHALDRVGTAWTELPAVPRDEHELGDWLSRGLGRATRRRGNRR